MDTCGASPRTRSPSGRARRPDEGPPRRVRAPTADGGGVKLLALLGQQAHCLVEGDRFHFDVARQVGDAVAVLGVGAEAALADLNRLAILRVEAERPHLGLRLGEQVHGAVHAERQHVVARLQRLVGGAEADVGAEAADSGGDLAARIRVAADHARQRQQRQRPVEVERLRVHVAGQAGAAGLGGLALLVGAALAELHVNTVGAAAHGDVLAGRRIGAQLALPFVQGGGGLAVGARHRERPRVAAFRVVGAADEGARAAEPQSEPAGGAGRGRAGARIGAVALRGEEMRPQLLVQRVDDVADLEVLGGADRPVEVVPEFAHHRAPGDPPAGDVVELLFQSGGEAGVDVALEVGDQEGGDQPAAVLRLEAPLLQLHVVPVLQGLQDGGVGGGAADAQLLHALHQAGLREARRRLGEVLQRRDLAALHRVALAHRRQGAGVLVLAGLAAGDQSGAAVGLAVVEVLAVELEEAVEGDH